VAVITPGHLPDEGHPLPRRAYRASGAVFALLLAVAPMAACASEEAAAGTGPGALTLGFVNGGSTEFHTCLQKAVESEASRRGLQVVTANSKQDAKTELTNIQAMISRQVDAIIVQTVNSDALKADIARANTAKIPIFLTSVVPSDPSGILGAVAVDLNQIGLLDAGWVSNDAVGARAEAGIVAGAPGAASDLLVKGFTDTLPKNIKIVDSKPGMYNRGKAKAVAVQMIKEHPGLEYAFVANEDMAVGVSEAFRADGKKVKIVTVNGTDAGLDAIRDGRFAATVANPAAKLGQQAIENTLSLLNREPINKIDYAPISLVDRASLDQAPNYCLT
jgi:ribose transport system substrate-binding protein